LIIFLYGSDSYRLKQAGEDIVSRYRAKYSSGINLFTFNFADDIGENILASAIKSFSFFNEHKLIVCKNILGNKQAADTLAKLIKDYALESDPSMTLLAIESLSEKEAITKNKELSGLLSKKPNFVKVIDLLEGSRLSEWIVREFEIRGCSINQRALNQLINLTGNDTWTLVNEIEKLTAYKSRGVVGEADVALLVSPKIDSNIFDLIDAISSKNRSQGAELLYRELKSGRDPYYILTMIIYQFRNLLMVGGLLGDGYSQAEIAKKAKIHPFVVKKTSAQLSRFKQEEAVDIYRQLLLMDTGFKSGRFDLQDLLHTILQ